MEHKPKTQPGRRLYALRKQMMEPVFGVIKSIMGLRQFLLRGMGKVSGEWRLVCLAWNLKRMAVLHHKSVSGRLNPLEFRKSGKNTRIMSESIHLRY